MPSPAAHTEPSSRRWEDGQRVTKRLEKPDRWEVHAAERVAVTLGPLPAPLAVVQQPNSLTARRLGVGAGLWDGAILLAAYLAAQPHYKYVGTRAVELGLTTGDLAAAERAADEAAMAAAAASGRGGVAADVARCDCVSECVGWGGALATQRALLSYPLTVRGQRGRGRRGPVPRSAGAARESGGGAGRGHQGAGGGARRPARRAAAGSVAGVKKRGAASRRANALRGYSSSTVRGDRRSRARRRWPS